MTAAQPATIQLHLMPDAPGDDGTPRAALVLPAQPAEGAMPGRRAMTLLFASVGAALAEKRRREGVT